MSWDKCKCGLDVPHLKEHCIPPKLQTEAWVGPVQLTAVEGTRVLQLDGCTVTVASVFPDGTAYVITRKTFEKRVIDAARRKWKMQSYMHHYGTKIDPETYAQQAWAAEQMRQSDNLNQYMQDMMNNVWRKY